MKIHWWLEEDLATCCKMRALRQTYTWNSSVCNTSNRSRSLHAERMRPSSSEPSAGMLARIWSKMRYYVTVSA